MKISAEGLELIKSFEGFRSKPYLCPANVVTIGMGTIRYPNGTKVTLLDQPINEQQALHYLLEQLSTYEQGVDALVTSQITENQRAALISFAYNLGVNALKNSTLLKKVNGNPNDPTIVAEFLKWNKGGGKVLAGLTRRRQAESALYCK